MISPLQDIFRNCTPFIKCVAKANGTIIDDALGLYLVMLINNLLEYSSTCSDKTGSLWFYSK